MNQKSVLSNVIAKPPRRTTVAQMNPRVPSPVAAFSSTANRRAKSVSFFSGARTAGFIGGTKSTLLLSLIVILALLGSNMVVFPLQVSDICKQMSFRSHAGDLPSSMFFKPINQKAEKNKDF
ncbi:hypothetical protein IC575_013322 [Cucumis melo]